MADTPLISDALRAEERAAARALVNDRIGPIGETDADTDGDEDCRPGLLVPPKESDDQLDDDDDEDEDEDSPVAVSRPTVAVAAKRKKKGRNIGDPFFVTAPPVGQPPIPPAALPVAAGAPKCHIKLCHKKDVLIPCVNRKCDRHMHWSCFQYCVVIKFNDKSKADVQSNLNSETAIACTLGCFCEHLKESRRKVRVAAKSATVLVSTVTPGWDRDGAHGPDDPNNSLSILIAWLQVPNNFTRYRGKDNNGTRKKDFGDKIAALCNAAMVKTKRNSKQVQSKISNLMDQFKKASDWSNNTGVGVRASDEDGFHSTIRRICPNWDDLEEVMGDRALARPAFSSDDLGSVGAMDDDNKEEDEEEDDDEDDDDDTDKEDQLLDALADYDGDDSEDDDDQENSSNCATAKTPSNNKKAAKKRLPSSTPMSLPSTKKPKTKKAAADDELASTLLGTANQKVYYEDAKKRRARDLRIRVIEHKEKLRHNRAMERTVLDPEKRTQCYFDFRKIMHEPWLTDSIVMTLYPADIAADCIKMRKAELPKNSNLAAAAEETDGEGNHLYGG